MCRFQEEGGRLGKGHGVLKVLAVDFKYLKEECKHQKNESKISGRVINIDICLEVGEKQQNISVLGESHFIIPPRANFAISHRSRLRNTFAESGLNLTGTLIWESSFRYRRKTGHSSIRLLFSIRKKYFEI